MYMFVVYIFKSCTLKSTSSVTSRRVCVCVVCAARTWTPEGETQRYRYTPTATNVNQHAEHVDVDGELFYNVSMMAAEVGTAACEGRS